MVNTYDFSHLKRIDRLKMIYNYFLIFRKTYTRATINYDYYERMYLRNIRNFTKTMYE